ncbi:hypothetical protein BJ508DRAFT_202323 [Ascobolus immersus RN42]|uniref:AA9 family lytic polysaccharide monooxygenase n=1 Tax=Ascobolus immersus RN42 TaxID=1160509 RepID=A0A3N4J326_ASCIM|nr:hypothetical protein BJ508DRAFT_202323 [Ascobolus immersus RN42]
MKGLFSLLSFSALFLSAAAHTTVWYVAINGVQQAKHVGIRKPDNAPGVNYNNSPVKDLKSNDIACNRGGSREVPKWIDANAGDDLTFIWYLNQGDDIMPSSHKGPVMAFLTPEINNINGANVWTKIWEDGLVNGVFGTERLMRNQGKQTVKIPAGLKPGKYLFRADMAALHEADVLYSRNSARGTQFYPNCIQINIVNGGNVEAPKQVSFPGTYHDGMPGLLYNIWSPYLSNYPVPAPGGPVWKP